MAAPDVLVSARDVQAVRLVLVGVKVLALAVLAIVQVAVKVDVQDAPDAPLTAMEKPLK